MQNKKEQILMYLHSVLLFWFLLFVGSFFLPDGGKAAGVLAMGNAVFLFANIPFSLVTLVLKAKGQFSGKYNRAVAILSVLNICVGIAAWLFVAALLRKP